MFNVGNNLLSPPLPGLSSGAMPGLPGATGYGAPPALLSGDGISPTPQAPGTAPPGWSWFGGNNPGGFINQFMSTIFAAFTQMAQYLTSMFGTPPWGPNPYPSPYGGAPGPAPQPPPGGASPQQFFSSANFHSTGDPHDGFTGTTPSGETIGGKWNNMLNHPDLLHSNSFAGGYRISTDVGSPNEHGVTRNDTATIETNYGRTAVTMTAGGQYSVTQNGKAVELEVGQAKDLGNGESVTLNQNGSLTVVDRNATGGEITTTLTAKNGGVNVDASASNVDLGGYLVRHSERMGQPGPVPQPGPWPQPYASPQPYQPYQPAASYQPYQPAASYQPLQSPGLPSIDSLLGT